MTDQNFGNMDESKLRKIASEGGQTSSRASSTAKDMSQRLSDAGKKGAKAQSTDDKAKGGHNSHRDTE